MSPTEAVPRLAFAHLLGVKVRTLDRWRREGLLGLRLPVVRVGTRPHFRLADYQWWQRELERRLEPPPAPRGRTAGQREKGRRDAEEALRHMGLRNVGDGPQSAAKGR